MYYFGGWFDVKSGKQYQMEVEARFPIESSLSQTNERLYICGGYKTKSLDGRMEGPSQLMSVSSSSALVQLSPLPEVKGSHSLSGVSSLLICIGGSSGVNSLKTCSQYWPKTDKWEALPALNIARQCCGSVLLLPLSAYSFCGVEPDGFPGNSVESLDLLHSVEWRVLLL